MAALDLCAVDLGNTSGRVIKAHYTGSKLDLNEVHRFSNGTILMHKYLKQDFIHMLRETVIGLTKAGKVASVGIDSWAVDFGLLDAEDEMILIPHHHRDGRSLKAMEQFDTVEKQWRWYQSNGISFQAINTAMQLYSMVMDRRAVLDHAESFLMIPDLLVFYLTGVKVNEATNASTTQLISLTTGSWDKNILDEIGITSGIFKDIVGPGISLGPIRSSLIDSFAFSNNPEILTVGSHDTASAVHATPLDNDNSVFISSGTWSLFGTIRETPIVSVEAMRLNYNNERATDGKIRFLKNSVGMWIIEEILRIWSLTDCKRSSYEEVIKAVKKAKPFLAFLDPNLPRFYNPHNMVDEITSFFIETGQNKVNSRGEIMRTVLEGMAFSYREALDDLEKLTNTKYEKINIVGGGSKNSVLNQFTSNVCGLPVIAGPVEATAIGNTLSQLEYHGEISNTNDRYDLIRTSFDIDDYTPYDYDMWNEEYRKYNIFFKKN